MTCTIAHCVHGGIDHRHTKYIHQLAKWAGQIKLAVSYLAHNETSLLVMILIMSKRDMSTESTKNGTTYTHTHTYTRIHKRRYPIAKKGGKIWAYRTRMILKGGQLMVAMSTRIRSIRILHGRPLYLDLFFLRSLAIVAHFFSFSVRCCFGIFSSTFFSLSIPYLRCLHLAHFRTHFATFSNWITKTVYDNTAYPFEAVYSTFDANPQWITHLSCCCCFCCCKRKANIDSNNHRKCHWFH